MVKEKLKDVQEPSVAMQEVVRDGAALDAE